MHQFFRDPIILVVFRWQCPSVVIVFLLLLKKTGFALKLLTDIPRKSDIILARKRMCLDFIPYVVVQSLVSDFQIIIFTINLDYVCFCQVHCSSILWFVEINCYYSLYIAGGRLEELVRSYRIRWGVCGWKVDFYNEPTHSKVIVSSDAYSGSCLWL